MTDFKFVRLYAGLTDACQYICKHCFAKKIPRKAINIDLDLLSKFIDDFGSVAKAINFTGMPGNPLLYPYLKEAIRICKARIGNVSINTRGYIKDDILDYFALMDVVVYYSMDRFGKRADEDMQYNGLWEQQLDTLKRMINKKISVAIRTTIMRDNFGDVLQLMRMVENLRMKGVNIVIEMMPYLPYHDTELVPSIEQMKQITSIALNKDFCRLLTPWWTCIFPMFRDRASRWCNNIHGNRLCEAGRKYGRIAIKHDGTILPCPFETRSVGKYIKINGEWTIDKVSVNIKLEEYLDSTPKDDKCDECIFDKWCGGGCRVVNNLGHEQVCPIPDLWK